MKGNDAIAEAAVRAGCRFFAGYPITPQNEVPEYLSWRLPQAGGVFVQAESEVAAINMVFGAAGAGFRALTSSSSPGISLKLEGISYLAGAELPCVIINVMRAGPGLGGIQPAQGDYFQATKGGGHGDYRLLVLSPSTIQEAVDLMSLAFEKADQYRIPVLLLIDGLLAQMMEPVELPEMTMPTPQEKPWATVGWENKNRPRAIITSEYLDPTELENHNLLLQERYADITANERRSEAMVPDQADLLVVAYGSTARIVQTAVAAVNNEGGKTGWFRPISLWPFPTPELLEAARNSKKVLVVEMSSGQMVEDVRLAVNGSKDVSFYGRMGGLIPSAEELIEVIKSTVVEA